MQGEGWEGKSLEELGANKPGEHGAGRGGIQAHCLFVLHPQASVGMGGKGLVFRGGEGNKNVGWRVMQLTPFIMKENWVYPQQSPLIIHS